MAFPSPLETTPFALSSLLLVPWTDEIGIVVSFIDFWTGTFTGRIYDRLYCLFFCHVARHCFMCDRIDHINLRLHAASTSVTEELYQSVLRLPCVHQFLLMIGHLAFEIGVFRPIAIYYPFTHMFTSYQTRLPHANATPRICDTLDKP